MQLELARGVAPHRAAVAQRLLELAQRAGVDRGLVAELAGELVEVDVVHPGAAVGLGQLVGERVEVGEVLQHAGAVAEPETLLAVEPLRAAPVLAGAQRLQVGVELGQRLHQLRRPERLRGELHQLLALLGAHRVEHPLRGGGPLGQRVEQLVDVVGALREEVAVLVHELLEVLVGVLAALVLLQQLVEVVEHLVDRGAVLVGGALERLLHAGEPLVEQLPAEQVLDLLVVLAGLAGGPVVVAQLAHGRRGGVGEVLELHLAEGAVGVVHHGVAGQLLALLEQRVVEQLLDLLEGAVEVVALQQVAAPLGHPAGEVVEAGLVLAAAAQELPHRPLRRVARHHVLADRVEGLGDVDRRRERVAAVVAAEAGAVTVRHWPSRTRPRRAAAPWGSRPLHRRGRAGSRRTPARSGSRPVRRTRCRSSPTRRRSHRRPRPPRRRAPLRSLRTRGRGR